MSELLPQLQPRHAFDVRVESQVQQSVAFLSEHTLVYGVGRHLAVHSTDVTQGGGGVASSMGQSMSFVLRPFVDRPPVAPVAAALGGAGLLAHGGAHGSTGGASALQQALSAAATAALLPASAGARAVSGTTASSGAMLSELSARQHAAQLSELLEKESFLQDRTTLLSCFGLIPGGGPSPLSVADGLGGGVGSVSSAAAPSSLSSLVPERGAKKQLALGEYSRDNRMTIISICDLRELDAGGGSDEMRQTPVKDIRTHTLFLPWALFMEKSMQAAGARSSAAEQRNRGARRRKAEAAKRAQEQDAGEEKEASPDASAAAAAHMSAAASSSAAAPAASPHLSVNVSRSARAAAVPIELSPQASSASRIIGHKLKDRSAEVRERRRQAKAEQRARERSERKQARIDAAAASGHSGPLSSSEEDDEASDDSDASVDSVDSEDEALLSEHEEGWQRQDEDFDYDAAAAAAAESSAGPFSFHAHHRQAAHDDEKQPALSPSHAKAEGSAPGSPTFSRMHSGAGGGGAAAPASRNKSSLSRKLTHRLAQTPINLSLAVAYKHGLFQQPLPGSSAAAGTHGSSSAGSSVATASVPPSAFTKAICLEFSADGRFLAIQCDGPRWPLMVWDWQFRQRIMGHPRWVRQAVFKIQWNPHDSSEICVMGPQVFLQYSLQSSSRRQDASVTSPVTLLHASERFQSFSYLLQHPGAMVVAKDNKVLVLRAGVVIQSIDLANVIHNQVGDPALALGGKTAKKILHQRQTPTATTTKRAALGGGAGGEHFISSLCSTAQGFAVGTSIHAPGTPYPFAEMKEIGVKNAPAASAGGEGSTAAARSTSTSSSATSLLLLFEFHHTRTLDITPHTDVTSPRKGAAAASGSTTTSASGDRVLSTTLFDRSLAVGAAQTQALQAFRTKCIPLWRTHTGSAADKPLPFSLHGMAVSPDLTSLALTSSTREVFLLSLADVDLLDENEVRSSPASITAGAGGGSMHPSQSYLRPIVAGLHGGAITSMDISQEQPLILTASAEDGSIRLYNYVEQECEAVKVFHESPTCVALHPSGMELLVSFDRTLLQLRILLGSGEFLLRGEVSLSGTTCIKYSTSGSLFACVSGRNTIHLYATNTLKLVARFFGHTDSITGLAWSGDDSLLSSVGSGGVLYTWSIHSGARVHSLDCINHAMSYHDVLATPGGGVVAVGVEQYTLGFDPEGILNPKMHFASNAPVAEQGNSSRPPTRSGASTARERNASSAASIASSAAAASNTATHKFVIQWSAAPASAAREGASNPELLAAMQYVHYPDSTTAVVTSARGKGNKAGGKKDDVAHSTLSPSPSVAAGDESSDGLGANALHTVTLPIKPYLPVATELHRRAVAKVQATLAAEAASSAPGGKAYPMFSARGASKGPTLTASTAVSAAAQHEASLHARGPSSSSSGNAHSARRAINTSNALSSFLHSDIEKEECPMPPLLHAGLLTVGRVTFLLLGTPRGTIQVFSWPLHPGGQSEPLTETALHTEPITALRVCQKTGVVVSTSLDGSVFVCSMALVLNHALGSTVHSSSAAHDSSDASGGAPAASSTSPAAAAYAHSSQAASWSYIFPAHLFLSKSFFPPLYALISPRLRQEIWGEQKRLIDEEELVVAPLRTRSERMARGVRRIETEEEFDTCVARRGEIRSQARELAELRGQMDLLQSEWAYKQRRDAQALSKLLAAKSEQHEEERSSLLAREKSLAARDADRERSTLSRLAQKEKEFTLTLVHLENLYEKKLALESERYNALVKKMSDREMRASIDAEKARRESERVLSSQALEHASEVARLEKELASFESKFAQLKEESIRMQEEEAHWHDEEFSLAEKTFAVKEKALGDEAQEAEEKQGRLTIQLQQSRMKIERAGQMQREADAARSQAETQLKEIKAKNAALVKAAKASDDAAASSAAALAVANARAEQLSQQRTALREQVAHLLDQARANNPSSTIAAFTKIVEELDSEFLSAHHANASLTKAQTHAKATIHSLGSEVSALKKAAAAREELFERLREDIGSFKDMRSLREKYHRSFLQQASVGKGFGAGSGVAVSSTEAAQRARVEQEFSRQTHKTQATISHLTHRLAEAEKQARTTSHAQVDENVLLMRQVNDLRYVNRDFKAEIVRLTGEVAHQKLVMLSHGIGGRIGGGGAGGEQQGGPLSTLVQQRRVQVAAEVASAAEPIQPSAVQAQLANLNELLLVERYTAAAAQSEVARAESVLRDSNAQRAGAAEHFEQLAKAHEEMLVNSYRRISEQEEEIKALKRQAALHQQQQQQAHSALPPAHPGDHSGSGSTARRPQPQQGSSAAAGSYVDSVIQRASVLRSQWSNVGGGDDDDGESAASRTTPSSRGNVATAAHARPHSAANFMLSPADTRNNSMLGVGFTTSIAVPPRDHAGGSATARGNVGARPQTAMARGADSAGSQTARPSSAAQIPPQRSAVAKGGRAARMAASSAGVLQQSTPAAATAPAPRSMVSVWLDSSASGAATPSTPASTTPAFRPAAPGLRPASAFAQAPTPAPANAARPSSAFVDGY